MGLEKMTLYLIERYSFGPGKCGNITTLCATLLYHKMRDKQNAEADSG